MPASPLPPDFVLPPHATTVDANKIKLSRCVMVTDDSKETAFLPKSDE
jgi:hypothetical protein